MGSETPIVEEYFFFSFFGKIDEGKFLELMIAKIDIFFFFFVYLRIVMYYIISFSRDRNREKKKHKSGRNSVKTCVAKKKSSCIIYLS